MANRKISDLTALIAPVTGDLLPIVDISEAAAADKNKKITYGTFLSSAPLGTAAAPSFAFTGDSNTGIYSPGADQLAIATGGTVKATVDSSGRLLVGTSNARVIEPYGLGADGQTAHTYESSGDSAPGPGIALGSSSTTARFGPYLYLFRSRGGSVGSNTSVSSGDNLGTISFAGADGTDVRTRGAAIHCEVDGTPGASDMPGRLVFSTTADGAASPTERMTMGSSGWVSLKAGTSTIATAGNMLLYPDGNGTNIPLLGCSGASSSNGELTNYVYSTSLSQYQFYVGYAGTVFARSTSISSLSDQREKENIIDLETGLSEILALQPRRFDWKDGSGQKIAGFIAQEVEPIFPDLVDDYQLSELETRKSLKMGDLIPTLVKAIQQQQVIIAELQTRLTALEGA